jgi:Fur family transcriptional regulator, ferric uptake regulator
VDIFVVGLICRICNVLDPEEALMQRSGAPGFDHLWRCRVEALIGAAGMRRSTARGAVLDWIAATDQPFTAEMITYRLPGSSRPTIYRTLDWLRTGGWLARLAGEGNDRAYARSQPGSHHLICTDCGGVQIVALDLVASVAPQLHALDFELQEHHLEVYGRCRTCRSYEEFA